MSLGFGTRQGRFPSGYGHFASQAELVLDAREGVLKSGGTAAGYYDSVPTWENQATGTRYLYLPGIAANYASVPHAANLAGFGDLTLQLDDVTMPDWTPSSSMSLFNKYLNTGNQKSWSIDLATDGKIFFTVSFDGAAQTTYSSTVATGVSNGATASLRVLRTGSDIKFYVDTGSGFSQLGTTVAGVDTALFGNNPDVGIGAIYGGSVQPTHGSIVRARIWSDATQTTNVLDIDFSIQAKGVASFACATGQTVTVHSTAINTPAAIQQASGSDARNVSATLQPKYLPWTAAEGNYAHFSGVAGNHVQVPDAANLDAFYAFSIEVTDLTLPDWTVQMALVSKWIYVASDNRSYLLRLEADGKLKLFGSSDGSSGGTAAESSVATGITDGDTASIRVTRYADEVKFYVDSGSGFVQLGTTRPFHTNQIYAGTADLWIGEQPNLTRLTGKMTRCRIWNTATPDSSTPILDVNFGLAAHGASSFTATSGQTATVATSGINPTRIIGHSVIRTDGSDDYMVGTWADKLTPGRYFMVCTRWGGEGSGRNFNTWGTTIETSSDGFIHSYGQGGSYYSGGFLTNLPSEGVRFIREVKCSASAQSSKLDAANEISTTKDMSAMSSTDYALTGNASGGENSALDIEFLGIYPLTMSDVDAASLVSTLNERFDLYPVFPNGSANTYSASFDGTDDYVDCGTGIGDALGDNYTGDLSVSMWLKADTVGADDAAFSIGAFAGAHGPFTIHVASTNLYVSLAAFAWYRIVAFADTTNWNHVVAVYKAGSEADSKLYLNGVSVGAVNGTFPATTAMDFAGMKTAIGAYKSASYTFDGKIDECAIWNSALDADAVLDIYNNGRPKDLTSTSPLSWWRMGDGASDGFGTHTGADYGLVEDVITTGLGAEALSDTSFDDASAWTIAGITGSEVMDVNTTAAGKLHAYLAQDADISQAGTMVSGQLYLLEIEVDSHTQGSFRGYTHTEAWSVPIAGTGTFKHYFRASGTDFKLRLEDSATFTATSISLKPVNGNAGLLINGASFTTDVA